MENNQGQGAASEAGRPVRAAHAIGPHVFRLLPSDFIRSPLSLCLSMKFWPRDPVGASPTCPLALKNRLTKNMAHSHRPIQNPPMTSYVNRSVCAPRVCHRLSLPPQTLCRKPVSRGHSQRAPQPLWQPDLAALRKLHPATQTTHQPQQRFSTDC